MKNLTLLVMAAGMGSRYGGLKQLDPVGPSNETIIDYSVYDAIKAGFSKIIFVIRKDFENQFRSRVSDKYSEKISVEYAFQDLNSLPDGYRCPDGRKKPWGTGHAILSARSLISEPFAVINGDDFYGRESFKILADYYKKNGNNFSMVAFNLVNTLSQFGGVSRGVCTVKNNFLKNVIEVENIQRIDQNFSSDATILLSGNELVSMNMWGFTPIIFEHLEINFKYFLDNKGSELKSEFLIPEVVSSLSQAEKIKVKILNSAASWFGVTYKEDKSDVIDKIKGLIDIGSYPEELF